MEIDWPVWSITSSELVRLDYAPVGEILSKVKVQMEYLKSHILSLSSIDTLLIGDQISNLDKTVSEMKSQIEYDQNMLLFSLKHKVNTNDQFEFEKRIENKVESLYKNQISAMSTEFDGKLKTLEESFNFKLLMLEHKYSQAAGEKEVSLLQSQIDALQRRVDALDNKFNGLVLERSVVSDVVVPPTGSLLRSN